MESGAGVASSSVGGREDGAASQKTKLFYVVHIILITAW